MEASRQLDCLFVGLFVVPALYRTSEEIENIPECHQVASLADQLVVGRPLVPLVLWLRRQGLVPHRRKTWRWLSGKCEHEIFRSLAFKAYLYVPL